jgi:HEAT repeat protein
MFEHGNDQERCLDDLVSAIGSDSRESRIGAIHYLERQPDPHAIEPLIGLLSDPDEYIGESTTEALVALGPPAVERLIEVLTDQHTEQRVQGWLIRALGSIHDARAFEPLMAIVQDRGERNGLRDVAIFYLGRIHDSRVIPALIDRALDPNEYIRVRNYAVHGLGRRDPHAISALIALLVDSTENGRRLLHSVSTQLGLLRPPQALDPLMSLLDASPERDPYNSVLVALGKLGEISREALLNALSSGPSRRRARAAHALGLSRAPQVLEPLLAVASDPDIEVRREAIGALGWFNDDRALAVLVNVLKQDVEPPEVRARAASALGMLGKHEATEPLLHALSDSDSTVRARATWALGQLYYRRGPNAPPEPTVVDALLGILDDPDERVLHHAVEDLRAMRDPRAVEPLLAILSQSNLELQRDVIEALGRLRDPRALPMLERLSEPDAVVESSDQAQAVQDAAVRAINRIREVSEK